MFGEDLVEGEHIGIPQVNPPKKPAFVHDVLSVVLFLTQHPQYQGFETMTPVIYSRISS